MAEVRPKKYTLTHRQVAALSAALYGEPVEVDLLSPSEGDDWSSVRRRAERQDATRRRIVEATVELHRTVGPARTTISAVASKSGVQRHTVYRHFPDEASLLKPAPGYSSPAHRPPIRSLGRR